MSDSFMTGLLRLAPGAGEGPGPPLAGGRPPGIFMPRLSLNDDPLGAGLAGEELAICGCGRCMCGGSLKALGMGPPGCGPGDWTEGGLRGFPPPWPNDAPPGGPPGLGGGCARDSENCFIFSAMLCGNCVLRLGAGPAGLRAALSVPSGVEEAVMLDTGADEPMSLCARGDIREPFGLVGSGGEDGDSACRSGEVGDSNGLVISCSSAMVGSERQSKSVVSSGGNNG